MILGLCRAQQCIIQSLPPGWGWHVPMEDAEGWQGSGRQPVKTSEAKRVGTFKFVHYVVKPNHYVAFTQIPVNLTVVVLKIKENSAEVKGEPMQAPTSFVSLPDVIVHVH